MPDAPRVETDADSIVVQQDAVVLRIQGESVSLSSRRFGAEELDALSSVVRAARDLCRLARISTHPKGDHISC